MSWPRRCHCDDALGCEGGEGGGGGRGGLPIDHPPDACSLADCFAMRSVKLTAHKLQACARQKNQGQIGESNAGAF